MTEFEEIDGFQRLSEYENFCAFLEWRIAAGDIEEIAVDPDYEHGLLFGGRWFRETDSGTIWRLLEPDIPFRGLWERVIRS